MYSRIKTKPCRHVKLTMTSMSAGAEKRYLSYASDPHGTGRMKEYAYRLNAGNQYDCAMAMKSAAFRAAPPIRPPSMSGHAKSSLALEGLQLPPYRMMVS